MAIILGTSGPDNFTASSSSGDDYRGFGGNDTITGGPGIDTLNGNLGDDIMHGSGNDGVFGGQGNDLVVGSSQAGNDTLYGNKGEDILIASDFTGFFGGNLMFGGQGNDRMYAVAGTSGNVNGELMFGDLGDDLLFSNGNDTLVGGGVASDPGGNDGSDTLLGGFGNQLLIGGTGNDFYLFQRGVSRSIAGGLFTEGGYGGQDVIRGFELGTNRDVIDLFDLASGDGINITELNGTSAVIALFGSLPGVIVVEDVRLSNLLSPGSNNLNVNGVFVNLSNGSFDSGRNVFTYQVA
jgi:Ca2+-binding RTX toxin-like protein